MDYMHVIQVTWNGDTLLHVCAANRSCTPEFVCFLLQAGVPKNSLNHRGLSPVAIARSTIGGFQILKAMLLGGACAAPPEIANFPLHCAVLNDSSGLVQALLDRKADPNQADMFGRTALHLCAVQPHFLDCAEVLLLNGAKTNLMDDYGMRVSEAAYQYSNQEFVKLLTVDWAKRRHEVKNGGAKTAKTAEGLNKGTAKALRSRVKSLAKVA